MLAYSVLAYGNLGGLLSGPMTLLTSALVYFLTIYLFFGIARLVYQQYSRLLWKGIVVAVIVACFVSGLSTTWTLVTGWGMLLLAGISTGRLTRAGYPQGQVYVIGAAIVAVLFTLQSLPVWSEFLHTASQLGKSFAEQAEQYLLGLGYTPGVVGNYLDQSKKVFDVLVRLFPAATILGALLQFSIGYLAFVKWVDRREPSRSCHVPIVFWKVPFGFAPVVICAILMRLLGGDQLRMIADNILAIMATYYCVAGLALIEYNLKRLHISRLMKVVFYLLLFLAQLAGFFMVALVGFMDSFADWRKVRTQEVV